MVYTVFIFPNDQYHSVNKKEAMSKYRNEWFDGIEKRTYTSNNKKGKDKNHWNNRKKIGFEVRI